MYLALFASLSARSLIFVIWLQGAHSGAIKTTESKPVRRSIGAPTFRPFMAATCDKRADGERTGGIVPIDNVNGEFAKGYVARDFL